MDKALDSQTFIPELNLKNLDQIKANINYLNNFASLNLVDKDKNLDRLEILKTLKLEKSKIILNYSITNNYNRSKEVVLARFKEFSKQCKNLKLKEILLVSGNPKRSIETIKMLEYISSEGLDCPEISVSYNPFFEDKNDFRYENTRLVEKLKFRYVKGVYLQIGDNINKINQAIKDIQAIKPETSITISILRPTKNILQKLKFRPWFGLNLSKEFLNSVEIANQKNLKIINLAKSKKFKILVSNF